MIDFSPETSYAFHKNTGYYTASAELGKSFNSDWCGNLTNPLHRQTLFSPDTYTLIFDATYHSNAICEDLFPDVVGSLCSGGVFIMQLSIAEEKGKVMCGHDTAGHHSMSWYSRELTFDTLENVYAYWEEFLISKGFSRVNFYKSPLTLWLESISEEKGIDTKAPSNLTENDIEELKRYFNQEIPVLSINSPVAQIDPHLAHYGLSTHYLMVWKD